MRVLGVPGLHARRRFRRGLPLPSICAAAGVAALSSGHPVAASLLGALSIAVLRRALGWRRGAEGEVRVSRALEAIELPGWAVNNVVLWRPQGDLDHVVILPWGVFVLETKSGRVLPGHSKQALRKAAALGTWLRRRGLSPEVTPAVVLAGPSSGRRTLSAGSPRVLAPPDLAPFLSGGSRAGPRLLPERLARSLHERSGGIL